MTSSVCQPSVCYALHISAPPGGGRRANFFPPPPHISGPSPSRREAQKTPGGTPRAHGGPGGERGWWCWFREGPPPLPPTTLDEDGQGSPLGLRHPLDGLNMPPTHPPSERVGGWGVFFFWGGPSLGGPQAQRWGGAPMHPPSSDLPQVGAGMSLKAEGAQDIGGARGVGCTGCGRLPHWELPYKASQRGRQAAAPTTHPTHSLKGCPPK
jgi:hypothetical protein